MLLNYVLHESYSKYLTILVYNAILIVMKITSSPQKLLHELHYGNVYRRQELTLLSKSVDRDLKRLTKEGSLKKVGPGLYLYPKQSRWGELPAETKNLARSFLKTSDFLMVSNDEYNVLGLGMTQLWNEVRVYNKRRHQKVTLGNVKFDFQVPFNGYPRQLTPEFLLVDLMNNLDNCGESPSAVKEKLTLSVNKFNKVLLLKLSQKYGKLATKKYFDQLIGK